MHASNYCTSSSCQLKAMLLAQHMSELQADPDSLFQIILISQANAWQIGLAASMCLFKATLSRGLRTEQSLGNQLYWESSGAEGKQALGTELDMHG